MSIGICNGLLGDNLPAPNEVVNLFNSHGVTSMRIYSPDPDTLAALQGSNVDLILGAYNEDLASLASDISAAHAWVQNYVLQYPGITIK